MVAEADAAAGVVEEPDPLEPVCRCAEVEGEAAAALLLARLVAEGKVSPELATAYHDAETADPGDAVRAEQQVE